MVPVDYFVLHQKLGPAITRFCLPVCRKYHINQTCFDVLMFLANNGEEYNTARDLCAVRGIKPGLASVAVETLIQRGYLARRDDPDDRRVRRLFVTEAAAPLVEEGRASQRAFFHALTRGIPEEELLAYKRTAEKLLRNICELNKEGTTT